MHLDHGGGAGALMRRLPNAKLVVHPRGARHVKDPTKLIAGASAVFGEEAVRTGYGDVLPVDGDRVIEAPEGFTLEIGGRPLRFIDPPGHARHHVGIWDESSRSWFTGDTFGLAYPELTGENGVFIFPTTTPVQFDPEAMENAREVLKDIECCPDAYATATGCHALVLATEWNEFRMLDLPRIREALIEPIHAVVEAVHLTLEKTPPELAADIVDRGIMLVGGGSLLRDLDHVLRQETKLPILRSEDPYTAVVHGAGSALDNLPLLKEVALA